MRVQRFLVIAKGLTCHFCGETAPYTCDTCGRNLCHAHIVHVGKSEVCGLADTEVINENAYSASHRNFVHA